MNVVLVRGKRILRANFWEVLRQQIQTQQLSLIPSCCFSFTQFDVILN